MHLIWVVFILSVAGMVKGKPFSFICHPSPGTCTSTKTGKKKCAKLFL